MFASIAVFCSSFLLPGPAPVRSPVAGVRPRAAIAAQAGELAEPKLESSTGFDFVPLLTALKAQDFLEADQLTRDGLITIAGPAAQKRGYVYLNEAPKLAKEDLATIERLWLAYSGGKFGYSVQAEVYNSKKVNNILERMYKRIGWSKEVPAADDAVKTVLLRWLPDKGNEFTYDLEKAPSGHLPLTSTLRGTQLLLGLLNHECWQDEEFKKQ